MNKQLAHAAGLGIAVLGIQVPINYLNANTHQDSAHRANADFSALVGSDDAINTKAILEANSVSDLESSGCVNLAADTSGLFGWYSEPAVIPHAAFAPNESMGQDIAASANTLAVLADTRVAIFESSAGGAPEFKAFTPAIAAPSVGRQVAVSPDGLEIAFASFSGQVSFFRRGASGWNGVAAAQVLNVTPQYTLSKALTYSSDGSQLFIERRLPNPGVQIFERSGDGNWIASSQTVPGKFVETFNRVLGWSNDRLLVSDSNVLLVYKRGAANFEFSHAIGLRTPQPTLNVTADGFNIGSGGSVNFYRFNSVSFIFQPSASTQISLIDTAVIEEPPRNLLVGASAFTEQGCGSLSFFSTFQPRLGKFRVHDQVRSVVSGPWGIVASTVSQLGLGEVYIVARDRIFGGQNPPVGSLGSGQGGFE